MMMSVARETFETITSNYLTKKTSLIRMDNYKNEEDDDALDAKVKLLLRQLLSFLLSCM